MLVQSTKSSLQNHYKPEKKMEPIGATTVAASWLWEKYGEAALNSTKPALSSSWLNFRWSTAEAQYRRRLLALYSTTKLLGNSKNINIQNIYIDVHAYTSTSASRRIDLEDAASVENWLRASEETNGRFSLLKILRGNPRLFVLGRPGAGKSTFMRKAVFECCHGRINKTPIIISLKEWSDSNLTLIQYIVDEFGVCGFPATEPFLQTLLSAGNALLLLDGLDEVPEVGGKRAQAIAQINKIAKTYPSSSIVITCRTAATAFTLDLFFYAEIADLLPQQQTALISNWFAEAPKTRQSILESWSDPNVKGLTDLAKTPLLLALFCLAYEETLCFPRRMVDLYEDAASALLRRWDSSRGIVRDDVYKTLSPGRKVQLISRFAFRTFSHRELLIRKDRACRIVSDYMRELPPSDYSGEADPLQILTSLEAQHGIVVERAAGVYAFSHLTLHEFFTAKHLLENSTEDELHKLLLKNATDPQWREVILMLCSLSNDATRLIGALLYKLDSLIKDRPEIYEVLKELHETREFMTRILEMPKHRPEGWSGTLTQHMLLLYRSIEQLDYTAPLRSLPLRIARAAELHGSIFSSRYSSHPTQIERINSFFRLASLVGECLVTSITPQRNTLLSSLFETLLIKGRADQNQ